MGRLNSQEVEKAFGPDPEVEDQLIEDIALDRFGPVGAPKRPKGYRPFLIEYEQRLLAPPRWRTWKRYSTVEARADAFRQIHRPEGSLGRFWKYRLRTPILRIEGDADSDDVWFPVLILEGGEEIRVSFQTLASEFKGLASDWTGREPLGYAIQYMEGFVGWAPPTKRDLRRSKG